MLNAEIEYKIDRAILKSKETDAICHLEVSGLGQLRIDEHFVILVTQTGKYYRFSIEKLKDTLTMLS